MANARTIEEANAVLQTFLSRYNARFTRPAAQPGSAYRPLPSALNLEDVCCFAYERTVANDNTVRLDTLLFQLLADAQRTSYAKTRVIIRRHLDGRISISQAGRRLTFRLLAAPHPPTPALQPNGPQRPRRPRAPSTWKPSRDHPWKKTYAQEQRRKRLKMAQGDTFAEPSR